MTDAEHALWYRLRGRRFAGSKFRRQVPIGPYVVDFLCETARVVVELDGGQHAERVAADRARTRNLNALGYEVVRFWNDEVLQNMEGVLETLAKLMEAPASRISPTAGEET